MKKKSSTLHSQAEARLSERKKKGSAQPATESDIIRLNHELEVHQIELEIQNEELMRERTKTEALLSQYTDLYDFGPMGYFTLARDSSIQRVNLAGANLLGAERKKLVNKRLGAFVSPESLKVFNTFLENVFESQHQASCDVSLHEIETDQSLWMHIEGTITHEGQMCELAAIDITDRKNAEDALESEKNFVEKMIETMQTIVLILDTQGHIVRFNAYMEQISGYALTEVQGKDWFDTFLPECDRKQIRSIFMKAIKDNQTKGNVNSMITKDGRLLKIEWHDKTLKDKQGNITGLISIGQDVTERTQTETELQESEKKFRSITEYSADAIFITDQAGDYVYVNQAASNLLGYAPEKLMTMNIADLSSPDEVKQNIENFKKLQIDNHLFSEFSLKKADGTFVPVDLNAVLLPNGLIYGSCRDISERKQAGEAMKRAMRRQLLSLDILKILNRPNDLKNLIYDIMTLIKETLNFDAVAIRLREGHDFPYFSVDGFSNDFLAAENTLCTRDIAGEIIRDSDGNPVLECMCGNILCGRTDPALPFFTPGGSFWTNSTTDLLSSTTENDRQARTRNRCNSEDYESVALIPLQIDNEILGLLQLNDHKRDRFSLDRVQFLEGIGLSIGIALKRNLLDEQIRMSEASLHKAQQVAHMGSWIWNIPSNQMEWSDEMFRIYGIEKKLFQGEIGNVMALGIHPDDRTAVSEANLSVIKDLKPIALEYRIVLPDGKIRVVWSESGEPVLDKSGNPVLLTGILHDITKHRQTEETLNRERSLLNTLMNHIPDHIYFKDTNSRFIMVNKAQAERCKLNDTADAIGRTDFDFFTEEHARKAFEQEQEIIRTGQPIIGIEEKETWPELPDTWVSTTKMPLVDGNGNIMGTFGISRDITERIQAGKEIKKNLREKEILLRELYHRTKNNMQVICSLLRLHASKLEDRKVLQIFRDIEAQIYSMALVHQKLITAKDLSHLNMKDYLSSLIVHIRQSYSEYMKDIVFHTEMEDVTILMDTAIPLGITFNELINNVLRHAFPDHKKGDITIYLYLGPEKEMVLEVSDNGIGLPDGYDAKKDSHSGLETVIDLIEWQLGGQIEFKNRKGVHCKIVLKEELYKPRV